MNLDIQNQTTQQNLYDKYEIIHRNKVPIINSISSTNVSILECLLSDYQYIYVEDNNLCLEGIISRSDYLDKFEFNNHINSNFLYIQDNQDVLFAADKLITENNIKEIPVINTSKNLLYIIRKRENIILNFDFDWSLCDSILIKQFFSKYNNIFYLTTTNKINGLIDNTSDYLKITKINDFSVCQDNDLLICSKYIGTKKVTTYTINYIYLTLLSMSAVNRLSLKGAKYFFFQSPINKKLRKENKIYLTRNTDVWTNEDLTLVYGDDTKSMAYWLQHDNKKIDFGEFNGRYLLLDTQSETYNVKDNQRVTCYQPQHYTHTIWVIGTCIVRGYGTSDEMTIPSILQYKLNTEGYGHYIVRNLGTGGGLNNYADIRDFVNILRSDVKEGDIIIHIGYNCWELKDSKLNFDEYYELSWLYNRKHTQRCFLNGAPHLTPYANKIASEYIYSNIIKDLRI